MLDFVGEVIARKVLVRFAVFRGVPGGLGLGEAAGCWFLGDAFGWQEDLAVGVGAE